MNKKPARLFRKSSKYVILTYLPAICGAQWLQFTRWLRKYLSLYLTPFSFHSTRAGAPTDNFPICAYTNFYSFFLVIRLPVHLLSRFQRSKKTNVISLRNTDVKSSWSKSIQRSKNIIRNERGAKKISEETWASVRGKKGEEKGSNITRKPMPTFPHSLSTLVGFDW